MNDILDDKVINSIIDSYLFYFDYQVKNRGKSYYANGNIVSVVRDGNTFISKIDGEERYEVNICFDAENQMMFYECKCPCKFPCKHEYAVLLAIKNGDYINNKLKLEIEEWFKKLKGNNFYNRKWCCYS